MGAKTGLLVYADGEVPDLLKQVSVADLEGTTAVMRSLYPGRVIQATTGSSLSEGLPSGWPGLCGKLAGSGSDL